MQLRAKPKITVDEFLAWAEETPGHFELVDGEIQKLGPHPLGHGRTKLAIQIALQAAAQQAALPCHMLPNGVAVRVSETTAYEPDALVYCGPRKSGCGMEVRDPVIIVEVLSASTVCADFVRKLEDYFLIPSVHHYLIADLEERVIIHHARDEGELSRTRIVRGGSIVLDPPGLAIEFEACFEAA